MKLLIIFITIILLLSTAFAENKWHGVDETVIEKFASEKGRQVKEPLIPLEGDIELFCFALFQQLEVLLLDITGDNLKIHSQKNLKYET